MSSSNIKKKLLTLEKMLRAEITKLPEIGAFATNVDRLSISALIETMSKAKLSDNVLFARLTKLDAAICQLDIGLYGICADCEYEIDPVRLKKDPLEQRCQNCDTLYKHQHRHELKLNH